MRDFSLRSTSFRLSLRYALLYALVTICTFIAAYVFAQGELRKWVEEDVRVEIATLEKLAETEGLQGLIEEVDLAVRVAARGTWIYQLSDADGTLLAGNAQGIPTFDSDLVLDRDAIEVSAVLDRDASVFLLREAMIGNRRLVVGRSLHLMAEALEILSQVLATGLIVLLLAGLGFGFLVGRRTDRRIRTISATLAHVAQGDLGQRIPVDRIDDDLTRISGAINGTLVRLEALVESQQQITTDIAHDLRTPIQRLRQKLEKTRITGVRDGAVIEGCIADVDAIISTFQALLSIAQIEGGARRNRFQSVDLLEICRTVASAFDAVAEDEGHRFTTEFPDRPIMVCGDQELLTQLTANLIENAIRHCPSPSMIALRIHHHGDQASIEVSDTGPGIPAQEQEQVLRRLYRLEKSRTTSGSGLGLSLVKAIADLHDATLMLEDNDPGLRVSVTFQKTPSIDSIENEKRQLCKEEPS